MYIIITKCATQIFKIVILDFDLQEHEKLQVQIGGFYGANNIVGTINYIAMSTLHTFINNVKR